MAVILLLFWFLLNTHIGWDVRFLEIALFGLLCAGAVWYFTLRFTKWTWRYEKLFLGRMYLFIAYAAVLLWNVVTANLAVIRVILSRRQKPEPVIVSFDVPLRDELLRTMLANSITLTPGTITVSVTGECFVVHCLKREYMDGFETCALVRLLRKMEEKLDDGR